MPSSTPAPHRRDLRRWQDLRRRHRTAVRRRAVVLSAAVTLVVAGVGAHALAPEQVAEGYAQVSAWVPGDGDGRGTPATSRSSERTPTGTAESTTVGATPAVSDSGASIPATTQDATNPADTGAPAGTEPGASATTGAAVTPDAGSEPAGGEPAMTAPQAAGGPSGAVPGGAVEVSLTQQIVDLTNVERAAAGLPALAVSACGAAQAQARTDLLVAEDRFEHDALGPVMRACGASRVGENLALGYSDARSVVAGWMGSQGHRENILRDGYTSIGVACTAGPRGQLCAQVFLG